MESKIVYNLIDNLGRRPFTKAELEMLNTFSRKYPYFFLLHYFKLGNDSKSIDEKLFHLIIRTLDCEDLLANYFGSQVKQVTDFEKLISYDNENYHEKRLNANYMINAVDSKIRIESSEKLKDPNTLDELSENISEVKTEKKPIFKQDYKLEEWLDIYDDNLSFEKSIIDKFVKEEPVIKPNRSKFFSSEDKAKSSLSEDYSMITETLAEIHIKQGNYKEAKNIYKKLIEKNPKKNSYFVGLIKNISKKA